MTLRLSSLAAKALAALLAATALAGCAPLLIGGAAAGAAMMATDRRSPGTQIEDETIELRAGSRMTEAFGDSAHINAASYNRQVLLTGEVPNDNVKRQAEQIASRIDNVRGVVNELTVMPPTSFTQRSNDTYITGKVRASFVDASELQTNAFRVVTERGTVYLMGRVTQAEADRATQITRTIPGVQKVVRVFELVTMGDVQTKPATAAAAPAQPASAPR